MSSLSAHRLSGPAVAGALVLSACGGGGAASTDEPALVRLCDAAEAVDPADARELFAGRTHLELHALADDLAAADLRPVAGDILEAKNRVEVAFDEDPVPDDLAERFDFLIGAVGRGLNVLDRPPLPCTD